MAYSVPESTIIDYPPEALEAFIVDGYEWIDNLYFTLPPSRFLDDPAPYVTIARKKFLDAGWDGDGQIDLIWLPPFMFPLALNIPPVGIILWHVKQLEDGTSWLLCPFRLPFEEFAGRAT